MSADIWLLMLLILVLGFFIEWMEISYIAVPLFLPVLVQQNVDLVWLAMLICVNLQTSFLTPPFGWSCTWGVIHCIAMQMLAVVLVFFFQQLALWAAHGDRLVVYAGAVFRQR